MESALNFTPGHQWKPWTSMFDRKLTNGRQVAWTHKTSGFVDMGRNCNTCRYMKTTSKKCWAVSQISQTEILAQYYWSWTGIIQDVYECNKILIMIKFMQFVNQYVLLTGTSIHYLYIIDVLQRFWTQIDINMAAISKTSFKMLKTSLCNSLPKIDILIYFHWNTDFGKWVKPTTIYNSLVE